MQELGVNLKKSTNPRMRNMLPVKGPVSKRWGSGNVWETSSGAIYGVWQNVENRHEFVFLGWNEAQALQRINLVKSFL